MPRSDEPRVMVRLSASDHETLKSMAVAANISLGGLLRECAMRYGTALARDVRDGDVVIRRQRAVAAVRGQVVPASSLVVRSPAEDWAMERQRRLNESADRSRAKR